VDQSMSAYGLEPVGDQWRICSEAVWVWWVGQAASIAGSTYGDGWVPHKSRFGGWDGRLGRRQRV